MSVFRITINPGSPAAEFNPNPREVFVNDSVFWFNSDQNDHWPSLISHRIPPNEPSEQVTFSAAGPVDYICNIHPDERGRIIVKQS